MEGVFPCAAAGISSGFGKEKRKIITCYGNSSLYPQKIKINKNTFFDLASLTKPLATTMAILCLLKSNKIDIDEKLPSLLEKKIKGRKKNINIKLNYYRVKTRKIQCFLTFKKSIFYI